MKAYDIIIAHCNVARVNVLAARCLRSIREYSEDYRVIWIQNGGPIPVGIKLELTRLEARYVIANTTNLGFVEATNEGLRISDAPYIVLMNNDTEAAPAWLQKLRQALEAKDVGISGPLSTASGSWQGRWPSKQRGIVDVPKELALAFFCTMIRRDVIEKVGLLDNGFGMGLGDDDDYCVRARAAGYRLALVQDLVIHHHHRSTFRALFSRQEIQDMQHKAVSRLKVKSNRISGS